METYEGRLASFKLHPSKRKVNEAYSSTKAWPHHPTKFSVTPATLASAGFYHDPTESATDNVTCVYCHKGLEGWENGDDALDEHLKRVIDKSTGDKCPWATMMGIKRDFDLFGPSELDDGNHDPMAQHLVTARRKTFGEWWKFDGKKGWKPTSDRLAQAGFYSTPLVDSPDTCACPYCEVQLDGWSKNDDPEEEHRSRQPDCFFFTAKASSRKSSAKSVRPNLKASTSTTRGKAPARDEDVIEVQDDPQPAKSNKLTASTSGKKRVPKKRSATETSIAEEAVSESANDAQLDETIQDVDETMSTKEGKKPAKAATKSRKSKAATTTMTATKKGTAKATKGKAEPAVAAASHTITDSVIDLASDSEADAPPRPPSPPTKPAPKPRKRTTRATSEAASSVVPPAPQEPEKTKKTRSTSSRSRSKKAPQEEEEQDETESVAPSENGLTTENETEASEAEPSQNKRSTRSKFAKSTSSAESRSTRAKGKKANATDRPSEVEVMSVSEASEVENTVAEESKVSTKKASSVKSNKSTRSTSTSSRKTASTKQTEESQPALLQSDIVPNAREVSKETNVIEDIQEGEILPMKKTAKKAAAPRKATKSKPTKRSTPAASGTRSTRSGHASDSVVQSESEASYATQTDDESMEETMAEMTRNEPSLVEMMDASTPKAIVKGGARSEATKMALPAMHHDTASKDQVTQAHQPDVPPPQESQGARIGLKLVPQKEDIGPPSTSPQIRPERTVKALPARRSRGESPVVSLPASSSIFAEKRAHPKLSSAAQPMPLRETLSRGQSALDALLAGPIPTFDSPEKTSSTLQAAKPLSRPAAASAPLAPASPAMKQASRSANVVLDDKTTVKEWLAVLRQQEMDRFDVESRKLLADFDKQTQKKREELSALLRRR